MIKLLIHECENCSREHIVIPSVPVWEQTGAETISIRVLDPYFMNRSDVILLKKKNPSLQIPNLH